MIEKFTLSQYAKSTKIEESFLKKLEIKSVRFPSLWVLEIPYFDEEKVLVFTSYCTSLPPKAHFIKKRGSRPVLYGLWKLKEAVKAKFVVLVDGESNCHTLWFNKFPALGLPKFPALGLPPEITLWKEQRDALHLKEIPTIYLAVKSDKEETLLSKFRKSSIRDKVKVLDLGKYNNPSEMYIADRDNFKERFAQALDKATPLPSYTPEQLWKQCQFIAKKKSIWRSFIKKLTEIGVVGENKIAMLLYLCLTTRFFKRPVSIATKGQSSGGKSFLTENVLKFFPKEVCYELTSMSSKALIYTDESFKHRFIWIYEASGLSDNFFRYGIRTLLSEGRIKYPTVKGQKPVTIEKEGPTGLILTTILKKLGVEEENRLISVTIDESPEQTKAILTRLAAQMQKGGPESQRKIDLSRWESFQAWLGTADHEVTTPFGPAIGPLIDPRAVRLRRDFTPIGNLIEAHAVIHQKNRERDNEGRIIATYQDYEVVHSLVSDLITRAIEDNVPQAVRETVAAAKEIMSKEKDSRGVSIKKLADKLKLNKSSVSRSVKKAAAGGFLKNLNEKKGAPDKWVIIEPLRKDGAVLPTVSEIKKVKEMEDEQLRLIGKKGARR